jgi:hypothetical protein
MSALGDENAFRIKISKRSLSRDFVAEVLKGDIPFEPLSVRGQTTEGECRCLNEQFRGNNRECVAISASKHSWAHFTHGRKYLNCGIRSAEARHEHLRMGKQYRVTARWLRTLRGSMLATTPFYLPT